MFILIQRKHDSTECLNIMTSAYLILAGKKLETTPFYQKVQLIEPRQRTNE